MENQPPSRKRWAVDFAFMIKESDAMAKTNQEPDLFSQAVLEVSETGDRKSVV